MRSATVQKVDGRYWVDIEELIRVLLEAESLNEEDGPAYNKVAMFLDSEIQVYDRKD